jgi:hypothetical protein
MINKTYSILKKRIFQKDKLISNGLLIEQVETNMSMLRNRYTFGFLGFPYYTIEEPEKPIYEHTWSLTGHRVFGDIYCTKCFLPKSFAQFKEHSTCPYEKEGN